MAWVTGSHLGGIWTVIIYWQEWLVISYGTPGSTYLPTGREVFQYFKTGMTIQGTLAEYQSGGCGPIFTWACSIISR